MGKGKVVVSAKNFLEALIVESNSDGDCHTLAEKLNMKPLSVYQRIQSLKKAMGPELGEVKFPSLPMSRTRKNKSSVSELVSFLKEKTAENTQV